MPDEKIEHWLELPIVGIRNKVAIETHVTVRASAIVAIEPAGNGSKNGCRVILINGREYDATVPEDVIHQYLDR